MGWKSNQSGRFLYPNSFWTSLVKNVFSIIFWFFFWEQALMLTYMPQMLILNYDSSPSNLPKQEKKTPLSTQGISPQPPMESICKASSSMSSAIRAIILIPPFTSHLSLSTQGTSDRPPKESICKAISSMLSSAIRAIILIPPLRSHFSPVRTHFDHFGAINT